MAYTVLTIAERIVKSKEYLSNAQNHPHLQSLLARKSYTDEKLAVGISLQASAEVKQDAMIREQGDQLAATEKLNQSWDDLTVDFTDLREISRIVFKRDRESQQSMYLHEWQERGKAKLEDQMRSTFNNLLQEPAMLEQLEPYGCGENHITELKFRLESIHSLKTAKEIEKNEAQQATVDRDDALAQLDEWMVDFLAIARIATRREPHLMELLGDVITHNA